MSSNNPVNDRNSAAESGVYTADYERKTINLVTINRIALATILRKEIRRFSRIWIQTIVPPAINAVLYMLIFGSLIGSRISDMGGFRYIDFIVPGIIMMSVIINSYSNVVSSFFSSKMQNYIEELLVSPVSSVTIVIGYVGGGMARGLLVGTLVATVSLLFSEIRPVHPVITLIIAVLTSMIFALGGLINAIFAKSFDDIALVPNFVLTPLTYLGGVFYSISLLPSFWQTLSLFNPVLYVINGFRFGILGSSDIPIWTSFMVIACFILLLGTIAMLLLNRGVGISTKSQDNVMANAKKMPKMTMAEQADRHLLYQASVQNPDFELDFIDATFKELRKRKPTSMREDFAGTAISSCQWVKRRRANTAIAVDIDTEVLDWSRKNNISKLTDEQKQRIELIEDDVLTVATEKVDVLQAYNFSYWFFQERATMLEYFRKAREALVQDGLLFLDVFGGSECYQTQKEKRKVDGFKYIWEQAEFNAITNELKCHIHFHFPDKSKIKKAFSYTWRVWGARELREILAEAGYSESIVYRQKFDPKTDEALDEYIATDDAEDYACWLGYIIAKP